MGRVKNRSPSHDNDLLFLFAGLPSYRYLFCQPPKVPNRPHPQSFGAQHLSLSLNHFFSFTPLEIIDPSIRCSIISCSTTHFLHLLHPMPMSMTTEDLLPSDNSSPRLSFSLDLIQPDNPFSPQGPATSSPNSDFDFNVSVEVAEARVDPSPADELFSNGKILPLPLKNPKLNSNPSPDPLAAAPAGGKNAGKKSLWKLGRSASLNCARSGMMKINFLRSYSTGSDPDPSPNSIPQPRPNPNPKPPRTRSLKKGCGNGGNRDYRMSPVPLFPKERGLIGFLLCNCVGGGNNGGMDFYRSP